MSHHTDQQVIICVNQQHHQHLARSHPSHLMTVSYQPRWTEITVSSTMCCWASRTYLTMTQEPGLQCVYTTNNGHQPCYTDKKPRSNLPRCFRYRFLFMPRCYLRCLSLDWSSRFPAGYQHLIYSIHLALSNKLSLKDNFFCREKDYEISTKLHTNKRWGTLDHLRCHPVATLQCYVPFFFPFFFYRHFCLPVWLGPVAGPRAEEVTGMKCRCVSTSLFAHAVFSTSVNILIRAASALCLNRLPMFAQGRC